MKMLKALASVVTTSAEGLEEYALVFKRTGQLANSAMDGYERDYKIDSFKEQKQSIDELKKLGVDTTALEEQLAKDVEAAVAAATE